jgi:hypothetical protein
LNRKRNAADKAPEQPWSTTMLAEIFMLLLEAAARAAKFEAAHSLAVRPDHIAGFSGLNLVNLRAAFRDKPVGSR